MRNETRKDVTMGMGAVTPLGCCGLGMIKGFEDGMLPVSVAGHNASLALRRCCDG